MCDAFPAPFRREALLAHLPASLLALPHVVNRIDALLMTAEELVLEAVREEQITAITALWHKFPQSFPVVLKMAAENNKLRVLKVLLENFQSLDVKEATNIAAKKNHLAAVRALVCSQHRASDRQNVAAAALCAAARRGHVRVVAFAREDQKQSGLGCLMLPSLLEKALFLAINAGHSNVVALLLESYSGDARGSGWDLEKAFDEAITQGQQEVIDVVFKTFYESSAQEIARVEHVEFPESRGIKRMASDDQGAMVYAAYRGRYIAVKYLYEHGHDSMEAVDSAFYHAARKGHVKVLQTLVDTGGISEETVDTAFELAATCASIDGVKFLYDEVAKVALPLRLSFEASALQPASNISSAS
jgi:hypothetical protein